MISAPTVTSSTYPRLETSGGPGVPGDFVLTSRLPGWPLWAAALWVAIQLVDGIEHRGSWFTFRNRTSIGHYDRFYQNFVPGAATADGAQVALTSYNNATNRTNLFNQTDVTSVVSTGPVGPTSTGSP